MIIAVSIVDRHKPEGQCHVGTYMFEVPVDAAASHYETGTTICDPDCETQSRPLVGRFMTKAEMEAECGIVTAAEGEAMGYTVEYSN